MIDNLKIRSLILRATPYIKRGSWATVEALVAPFLLIALSPWLLQKLGAVGFGQWTLALSISGFAHVVSLGAGVSTMFAVSASEAKNSINEGVNAIKAGLVITLVTSLIFIPFTLLSADLVASLFFSKMGETSTVANVLVLGVCILALQQVDDVLTGALRGMQRYDLVASLELIVRPLWAICIAVVAYRYDNVIIVLTTHVIFNLAKTALRGYMVMGVFKEYSFETHVSFKVILEIVNFGKWISLQSIGGVLFSTMDKIFVGWLFGSSDLARYSICIQVAQFTHNLQASGLQVITPWVVRKKLSKSSSRENVDFLKVSIWSGVACTIMPLVLIIFSWYLLNSWMGETFANNNVDLLRVLLLGTVALAFTIPAYYIVLGLNRAKFGAIILLAAGLVSLLCSTALTAYGLVAFSGGRLMYGFIALFYFSPLLHINKKIDINE